jgi:methionine synthase I (cobalamin-dependent)
VPEPFTNAAMVVWRGNAEYLKWSVMPNTPEEVLEVLRQYIELGADLVAKATEAANSNMPPVDPAQPQPVAALAPDVAPMLAS